MVADMNMEDTLNQMFEEANAKLPKQEQCWRFHPCCSEHDGYACTAERGHLGDHVAQGRIGYILARWPQASYPVPVTPDVMQKARESVLLSIYKGKRRAQYMHKYPARDPDSKIGG